LLRRWEDVAEEYLRRHPELRHQLQEKKKTHTVLAASANAQLNFVYKNSPYYEPGHMISGLQVIELIIQLC
jgi:hypothetical protein